MIKLLKIEWIKISRRSSFWILLGLFAIATPIAVFVFSNFTVETEQGELQISNLLAYETELIWQISAFVSSYLVWLPVVILVSVLSNDLNFNIVRQHVIEGLNRTEIITSKLLLVVAISAAATVLMALTAIYFVHNFGFLDESIEAAKLFAVAGTYFLYVLGYLSFALLLTLFLKSTGFTLILMLLWAWIAEPVIRFFDRSDVTDFLITNTFNDLIHNPILEAAGFSEFHMDTQYAVIGSLIWVSICLGLSYYKIMKSDL